MESRFALVDTEWGTAAVRCTGRGAAEMIWPQRSEESARRLAHRRWPGAQAVEADSLPSGLAGKLADYFAGQVVDFSTVPLDLEEHPAFRAAVLKALHGIGYGQTVSYGRLAEQLGRPQAARAVGQAVGANPLPVIVPCHRVLREDGGLGGFSADGGVALKRRLLDLEQRTANAQG